ncbi:MAG: peptidase M22 [Opitutaceae bacterium]|jgi:tRNA threonylcarbamoyladenosine biosynthesis protein TsaB|nr:peptidase M22 [Opitutaceae bacterium]
MSAPQPQSSPSSVPQSLSLAGLLDAHQVLLVLDAASARVQTGLLSRSGGTRWETGDAEAGAAIFSGVEKLLAAGALSRLDDVGAFVFCDGPGSLLGIRTAAVAIRSWNVLRPRPVYSYCSLELVARALALATLAIDEKLRDFAVIADARRDTWHRVAVDASGNISPLQRVPAAELGAADAATALVMPEYFRHWTPLPVPAHRVRSVPYSLASLLPPLADAPLFAPAPEPDAFLHEEPAYKTWTPQIHRAPATRESDSNK